MFFFKVRALLIRSRRNMTPALFFLLFLVSWQETSQAPPTNLPFLREESTRCYSPSHPLPVYGIEHPQWRMILGLLRRTAHARDPNELNRNVDLHKRLFKGGACLCFHSGRVDRHVVRTAPGLEGKTLHGMSREVGHQANGENAISRSQFDVAVALSVCICLVGGFVLGAIARPFLNKIYRRHFGRRANKPPGQVIAAVYSNAGLTSDQFDSCEINGDANVQDQQPSSSNMSRGNLQEKEMKIRNAISAQKARENMLPMFDIVNDDLSDTSSEVTMDLEQHPSALQGWEFLSKGTEEGAGAMSSRDSDDALYEELDVENKYTQFNKYGVQGEFIQASAGPVRCVGADKAPTDRSSLIDSDEEWDINAWLSQNATLKLEQPDGSDEEGGQQGHDNTNPFVDGKDALVETEDNPNGPLYIQVYAQAPKIEGNLPVKSLDRDFGSNYENLRLNEKPAHEQEIAQNRYRFVQNPVNANEVVRRTRSDSLCDSYRDESDVRDNVEAPTDLTYEKDRTSMSSRILLAHLPAFFNLQQTHSISSRDSMGSEFTSLPPALPSVPPPDEDGNSDNVDLDDEDSMDSDSLRLTSEEDAWMKQIIKEQTSSAPTSIPTTMSAVGDFSRSVVHISSNTVAFADASQSATEPSEELDFEAMSGGEVRARMEELRRRLRRGVLLSKHSMDPSNE
uniref:uncharacterized protein isoform X1 n=2 Tax=Myxine glutinosa TaxID=7769 RepID=UPI00358E2293